VPRRDFLDADFFSSERLEPAWCPAALLLCPARQGQAPESRGAARTSRECNERFFL
jgi:hypothetical protein